MANHEVDQPTPQTPEQTVGEPAKIAPPPLAAEAAVPELVKIEAPAVTTAPPPQPGPEPVVAVAPTATTGAAPIAVAMAATTPEAAVVEPVMRRADDLHPADVRADETITPAAPFLLSGWTSSS